jgi:DNA polymerase-3 subunit epsilon
MNVLLAYDTETTGLDVSTAEVVQMAVKVVEEGGRPLVSMELKYKPSIPISDEASSVHGITMESLEGCPPSTDAPLTLLNMIRTLVEKGNNVTIAGQNILNYDDKVIMDNLQRQGLRDEMLEFKRYKRIDTFNLARRVVPLTADHKLATLAVHFGILSAEAAEAGAHDAMFDVDMVLAVFPHLRNLASCEDEVRKDLVRFQEWCETPQLIEVMPFGKHKGKLLRYLTPKERQEGAKSVPRFYCEFIADKFDDPYPDLKLTLEKVFKLNFKSIKEDKYV